MLFKFLWFEQIFEDYFNAVDWIKTAMPSDDQHWLQYERTFLFYLGLLVKQGDMISTRCLRL